VPEMSSAATQEPNTAAAAASVKDLIMETPC